MAYCDLTDIQKYKDPAVYVQITNDLDGDTVDNGIIDEIVDKSANIIDSYIGGRYPLPLEVIPKIIRNIAIDLTVKFLYDRRLGEKDEIIEEAYENAIALLKDIRDGKLFIPELETTQEKLVGGYAVKQNNRIFTDEVLESF
ncbi:MAG: DUF1320 domain-containing protein [Spirochaetales bacterium]|nr:DUF1320 domain-containing protein [Spirochaetales bacterium]